MTVESALPTRSLQEMSRRLSYAGWSTYPPTEVAEIPAETLETLSFSIYHPDALSLADCGWLVIPPPMRGEVDSAIAAALNQPFRARLARVNHLELGLNIFQMIGCVICLLFITGVLQ